MARLRLRRAPVNEEQINRIHGEILEIGRLQDEREQINSELEERYSRLDQYMKEAHQDKSGSGIYTAIYEKPGSRSTSVIDVRAYRNLVKKDEDFFDSVTVSKTKAQQYLSGKQLEKITTVTPAKEKDPVLKVVHTEALKKSGK